MRSNQSRLVAPQQAPYPAAMRYAVVLFFILAGCSDFPELEGVSHAQSEDADFLDFFTVGELAALETQVPTATPADPLAGRIARLRARAALLRGPIFADGERARLSGLPG